MKRIAIVLAGVSLLALPLGTQPAAAAQAKAAGRSEAADPCQGKEHGRKCCPKPYKPGTCRQGKALGPFQIRVPGTHVVLRGVGTPQRPGDTAMMATIGQTSATYT